MAAAFLVLGGAASAAAAPPSWSPLPPLPTASTPDPFDPVLPPILGPGVGAHVSHNWFGYEQGAQMRGGTPFSSISAQWIVPRARPHQAGQAEAAADWIGIGGGCTDQACTQTDPTLIQTGTIDTVSRDGTVAYTAWYELIPSPPQSIAGMSVAPGDRIQASLSEQASNPDLWQISMRDLSRGEAMSTVLPYRSDRSSAEWIEEMPMRIGANAGLLPLPTLSQTVFSNATLNGTNAGLAPQQETTLRSASGLIGVPSGPTGGGRSFAVCAWATSCS